MRPETPFYNIAEYAERFVYKVYGASASGSGLLVLLPDGEIALLTAKHVISGMSPKEEIEIMGSNDKSIYIESLAEKTPVLHSVNSMFSKYSSSHSHCLTRSGSAPFLSSGFVY